MQKKKQKSFEGWLWIEEVKCKGPKWWKFGCMKGEKQGKKNLLICVMGEGTIGGECMQLTVPSPSCSHALFKKKKNANFFINYFNNQYRVRRKTKKFTIGYSCRSNSRGSRFYPSTSRRLNRAVWYAKKKN